MISHVLSLFNGKLSKFKTWDVYLFLNRLYAEPIVIEQGKTLLLASPELPELIVNGEGYIL